MQPEIVFRLCQFTFEPSIVRIVDVPFCGQNIPTRWQHETSIRKKGTENITEEEKNNNTTKKNKVHLKWSNKSVTKLFVIKIDSKTCFDYWYCSNLYLGKVWNFDFFSLSIVLVRKKTRNFTYQCSSDVHCVCKTLRKKTKRRNVLKHLIASVNVLCGFSRIRNDFNWNHLQSDCRQWYAFNIKYSSEFLQNTQL